MGDLWAVQLPSGRFGAAQVVDLHRSGPGSRKSLVAGVLDWVGDQAPDVEDLMDRRIRDVGLTRIEVFTETGEWQQISGCTAFSLHADVGKNDRADWNKVTITINAPRLEIVGDAEKAA